MAEGGGGGLSDRALATAATRPKATQTYSLRIDAAFLKEFFPAPAGKNIDAGAPYLQAALQEFKVADPRVIAAIVATIAVETANYRQTPFK